MLLRTAMSSAATHATDILVSDFWSTVSADCKDLPIAEQVGLITHLLRDQNRDSFRRFPNARACWGMEATLANQLHKLLLEQWEPYQSGRDAQKSVRVQLYVFFGKRIAEEDAADIAKEQARVAEEAIAAEFPGGFVTPPESSVAQLPGVPSVNPPAPVTGVTDVTANNTDVTASNDVLDVKRRVSFGASGYTPEVTPIRHQKPRRQPPLAPRRSLQQLELESGLARPEARQDARLQSNQDVKSSIRQKGHEVGRDEFVYQPQLPGEVAGAIERPGWAYQADAPLPTALPAAQVCPTVYPRTPVTPATLPRGMYQSPAAAATQVQPPYATRPSMDQPPLNDSNTAYQSNSVVSRYRNVALKFAPGSSSGPATIADARFQFKRACSAAGMRYEDAATSVDAVVAGTALQALLTWTRLNPSHTTDEAFDFLERIFDVHDNRDNASLALFTSHGAYTWLDFERELPSHISVPQHIISHLVLKGLRLQATLCSAYQFDEHLLVFLRNVSETSPFFAELPLSNSRASLEQVTNDMVNAFIRRRQLNRLGQVGGVQSTLFGTTCPPEIASEARVDFGKGAEPPSDTNSAQAAYLADVAAKSDVVSVCPESWQEMLDVFWEAYPSRQAYSTRRKATDSGLRRAGIRMEAGAKMKDTRDPPPSPGDDPKTENAKNRKGETMRCFSCNSRFHLLYGCPTASSAKKMLFAELLESVVEARFGSVDPTEPVSMDELDSASSVVLRPEDEAEEVIAVRYALSDDPLPSNMRTCAPIIVDTGCPLSVSGTKALEVDCLARGISFEKLMEGLKPTRRRFAFGATVLTSLGVVPAWYDAEDGRTHTETRHVLPSASLPHLMGLDSMDAMDAVLEIRNRALVCRDWARAGIRKVLPLELRRDGHLYLTPVKCRKFGDEGFCPGPPPLRPSSLRSGGPLQH